MEMLKKDKGIFITTYFQITNVSVMIKHHIKLKEQAKQMAQKLRRLGVVQREALLVEVKNLLKVSFIYSIEKAEWVSPVVITPKKNW